MRSQGVTRSFFFCGVSVNGTPQLVSLFTTNYVPLFLRSKVQLKECSSIVEIRYAIAFAPSMKKCLPIAVRLLIINAQLSP